MSTQNSAPQRKERIEEYFSCINSPLAHETNWPRAIELRSRLLPTKLFKYQAFDTNKSVKPGEAEEDFCLQNLRNRQIRFTAPLKFNDPYDSASFFLYAEAFRDIPSDVEGFLAIPEVRNNLTEDVKRAIRASDGSEESFDKIMLEAYPELQKSYAFLSEFRRKTLQLEAEGQVQHLNNLLRTETRVCCLCEIDDSIVMWSHYASNHRGFCLEYNSADLFLDLDVPQGLHPVRYHARLVDVTKYLAAAAQQRTSGGPAANKWAVTTACHKSPEWAYEKEWRVVALDGRDFSEVKPVSIILGARIDDLPEQKASLLQIANHLKMPLKRAVLRQDRFQLTVEPLPR